MKLNTTTFTTTSSSLTVPDEANGGEVEMELAFIPDGENGIRTTYVDNGITVSYLVLDQDAGEDLNPFTEGDSECEGYNVRHLNQRDLERYDEELNDPATMAVATDALTGPTTFIVRVQDHYQIECGTLTIGEFSKVVPWTKDTIMIVEFDKSQYGDHVDLGDTANSLCAEYAAWANGDIWGIVTERMDESGATMDDPEAVWGFLGYDHSLQMLDIYHNDAVEQIEHVAWDREQLRAAQ